MLLLPLLSLTCSRPAPIPCANQKVLVYDLKNLQATGLDIQGVLGEDFLEQFDMLIDNAHRLLCLDDAGTMRTEVKGTARRT